MAAMDFIDIYDKIQRSNGDYCKVCFRSSKERRLVTPVAFTHFLRTMKGLKLKPYETGVKVCYICESLALAALKFYRAVSAGIELEDLCQLIKAVGMRNHVHNHLNGTSRSGNVLCARAARSQRELARAQEALPHSLHLTDTLVVSVDRPVQQVSAMVPVVIGADATYNSEDTVIVRDTPAAATATVYKVRPFIQHKHMVVQLLDEKTRRITEHPIVIGLDGNRYVPSLKLQILPGDIYKSVPDKILQLNTNEQTYAGCQQPPLNIDTTSNGNEMVSLRDGNAITASVNSMQEMIYTENMNIILNFDEHSAESNSKKMRFSDENTNSDVSNESSASKVTSECSATNSDGREKRPVLSMDRVDWEDKIPMDVISFMDATDPHPEHRIMQPAAAIPPPAIPPNGIGLISNVRTIYDDDDVQILGTVECIDLC